MKTIASLKPLRLLRSLTARRKQGKRLSEVALGESASTGVAEWDKEALSI